MNNFHEIFIQSDYDIIMKGKELAMKILLVEDEQALCRIIAKRLQEDGYNVDFCHDGEEAELYIQMSEYDCIILDIMMPKKDGISVLKEMRSSNNHTPVLLLTAKDSIADRVKGLDAGADDYLVKPFSNEELMARVRSMLRRRSEEKSVILKMEDLEMDTLSKIVKRNETIINLTAKEYALLEYLLRNKDHVLTRVQITENIWGFDFDGDSNIVDVYIRYLRRKIDHDFEPKLIHTIRGSGYVMRVNS